MKTIAPAIVSTLIGLAATAHVSNRDGVDLIVIAAPSASKYYSLYALNFRYVFLLRYVFLTFYDLKITL